MALVVSEPDQKEWERPEDGQYLGVIVDVIDLGEVQTGFGLKPKVQIKWMLDAFNAEGEPFQVSAFYTASLHEKANLRKALKSILGADVSGQFDLEELLGINNQLVITTTESGEKTYTNIVAILKAPKGKRLAIPDDFQRKSEKDAANKGKTGQKKAAAPQLKKPAAQAPVAVEQETAPVEQETAPVAPTAPVQTAKAPAPTNRAATIRQARTVTPAPAVAPAKTGPTAAELRAQLAALEAAEPAAAPISDEDIPF